MFNKQIRIKKLGSIITRLLPVIGHLQFYYLTLSNSCSTPQNDYYFSIEDLSNNNRLDIFLIEVHR